MDKTKLGNVFILGDSYSTYAGCIPDGYAVYYDPCADDGRPVVSSPEYTWWGRLLKATDGNLVLNCSWSGTTVCNTSYDGRYCPKDSFIGRMDELLSRGNYNGKSIDTFLIFGGTNDCWAGAPIGEYKYVNITEEDKKCFIPAYVYLISSLKTRFPNSRILNLINCDLSRAISDGIRTVCEKFGCEYVSLEHIDKISCHPSQMGMRQIAEQTLEVIEKRGKKR